MTSATPPRVSAVIRALNEGDHIGRLIDGLRAQTLEVHEIIVVDSGSTDDTVRIAEDAGCRIVRIDRSEFSFGRALNRGCEAATGDLLLIASAHVYPIYDTYVEHLVSAFHHEGTAIAYGRQVGDERTKFSEERVMLQWFPEENIWDQGHPFSNNANAMVSRAVWKDYRYDETLTGLEDLDFAKRVLADGHKIAYVADAPVVHVHEETWEIIRNRYRREAIAYARIVENSRLSLPKALGLAVTNMIGDYRYALRTRRLARNLMSIPRFRFAQFIGAWEGFRTKNHVSAELLQRFYYPPRSRAQDPAQAPGRRIEYTDHRTT